MKTKQGEMDFLFSLFCFKENCRVKRKAGRNLLDVEHCNPKLSFPINSPGCWLKSVSPAAHFPSSNSAKPREAWGKAWSLPGNQSPLDPSAGSGVMQEHWCLQVTFPHRCSSSP